MGYDVEGRRRNESLLYTIRDIIVLVFVHRISLDWKKSYSPSRNACRKRRLSFSLPLEEKGTSGDHLPISLSIFSKHVLRSV